MAQPAYALPTYCESEAPKYYSSLTQPIVLSNALNELGDGGGSISCEAATPLNFYTFAKWNPLAELANPHGGGNASRFWPDVTYNYISISTPHGLARSAAPEEIQEVVRPPLLMSELKQISKLKRNWDGEGAEKPSPKTLKAARTLLKLAAKTMRARRERMGLSRALWLRLSSPLPDLNVSANQQLVFKARPWSIDALEAGLTISGATPITAQQEEPSESDAALYPTIDGAVTLKWIYHGRELKCTITGDSVEVVRWRSDASYESDGLWDLTVEQTREHFEWLMR
jgi:hypothetical protein